MNNVPIYKLFLLTIQSNNSVTPRKQNIGRTMSTFDILRPINAFLLHLMQ